MKAGATAADFNLALQAREVFVLPLLGVGLTGDPGDKDYNMERRDILKAALLPLFYSIDPSGTSQGAHRSAESEAVPDRFRGGTLTSTPYEGGPAQQADTLCCIHCGFSWVPRPGSGRLRGFCTHCNGYVCGRPFCASLGCVHREQLLDNLEAGRELNYVPIVVHVRRQ